MYTLLRQADKCVDKTAYNFFIIPNKLKLYFVSQYR